MIQLSSSSERAGRWFSLLVLCGVSAACGARTTSFETVSTLPEKERRPPGVSVDPSPALPPATPDATTADGLVVLSAPSDPGVARETVKEFFSAVVREAPEKIDQLTAPEAWVDTGSQRQSVRGFWRVRFSQLDYAALADEVLYRDSDLDTYRPGDLPRLSGFRPAFVDAQADDVVVRARVRVTWTGRTRLLGDEIFFLLRPDAGRYVIAEMAEDFRLP